MLMKVQLSSVGNPDYNQDPDKPLYGCEPNQLVTVKSYKEAQKVCVEFIETNDL